MSIHNEGQVGLIIGQRTHVPLPPKVKDSRSLEERIAAAHERRATRGIVLRDPAPMPAPVVAKAKPRPRGELDAAAIVAAFRAGTTLTALAREHHADRSTIRRVLDDAGMAPTPKRGGRTARDIDTQVRVLAARGVTRQAIADRLGVSRRTVERRLTKPQTGETA